MKIRVILLFTVAFASMTSKSYCQNKQYNKVDSLFSYHFNVLDSLAKNDFVDNTMRCIESIKFMELNTNICSETDGNYFGKTSFTNDDLKAWHNWYNQNKEKLYWCEKDKVIKIRKAQQ